MKINFIYKVTYLKYVGETMDKIEVEFEQEVQRRGSASLSITIPAEIRKKLKLKPGDRVKVKIVEVKRSRLLLPPEGMEFNTPFGRLLYENGKFIIEGFERKEYNVDDVEKRYAELMIGVEEVAENDVLSYIAILIRFAEILREASERMRGVPAEHSGYIFMLHFKLRSSDLENIFRVANALANLYFSYYYNGLSREEVAALFQEGTVILTKDGEEEKLVMTIVGDTVSIRGDGADCEGLEEAVEMLKDQEHLVFMQHDDAGVVRSVKVYRAGEEVVSYDFEEGVAR